ncbi:unnamed protein product [Caenorhabditis sp. 36 PRJEB53466]|nr:unnamed protein product [Caenorhabditis sp. 36 PRJEB53466]
MNFHSNVLLLLLVLVTVLVAVSDASTLRDMITKTIKKRQETTGGLQDAYTKLLPPHVAEMFLRRHF